MVNCGSLDLRRPSPPLCSQGGTSHLAIKLKPLIFVLHCRHYLILMINDSFELNLNLIEFKFYVLGSNSDNNSGNNSDFTIIVYIHTNNNLYLS